jgi:hypothetical protein
MAEQDFDQFQGRIARCAEDGNACHGYEIEIQGARI